MKDDEVTWSLTKSKYSIFTWDFWKYKNTTAHSENCLPELDIQAGFSMFYGFSRVSCGIFVLPKIPRKKECFLFVSDHVPSSSFMDSASVV